MTVKIIRPTSHLSTVKMQLQKNLVGLKGFRAILNFEKFSFILCDRYQDTHSRAYYMVLAGTRWLGIRLDLLSALLIGSVALAAASCSHDNGKHIVNIVIYHLFPFACSLRKNSIARSGVPRNG